MEGYLYCVLKSHLLLAESRKWPAEYRFLEFFVAKIRCLLEQWHVIVRYCGNSYVVFRCRIVKVFGAFDVKFIFLKKVLVVFHICRHCGVDILLIQLSILKNTLPTCIFLSLRSIKSVNCSICNFFI